MWAPPHRKDETEYYKFYRDHGHDTEDYQQLKEKIERLIKRGHLTKFVKTDKEKENEAKYRQQPPLCAGVINVIVDGIVVGGDSNSVQKNYAWTNGSILGVFLGLKISPSKIKPATTPLHGFGGATIIPEGTIELSVTLGTYSASMVIMTSFLLVKVPMAYNAIYGRPLLNAAKAVVSTYHQVIKFSTSQGVGCVRGDQQASRRCYVDNILLKNTVMMLDVEQPKGRIEPLEITEKMAIAKGQVLKIRGRIDREEKHKLVACLSDNIDVFPWGPYDIEEISSTIAQHRLAIPPRIKPIKQKKRQFALERQ
ncbi:Ribonuclease H [Abeliophyllum distichum]|uniref:Ribonuclease H n=1 Tax=Abeliophyllum distichum TaxID=126358 RepID=A0ABD1QWR2_9LAMI